MAQNVGIGTTAPEELLHIKNGNLKLEDGFSLIYNAQPGDTTGLRFYTDETLYGGMRYYGTPHVLNISSHDTISGLTYRFDSDQMFLGRDYQINSTERFGLSFKAPVAGWGGMYIEGVGPNNSRPFYGYAHDGAIKAFHYYDVNDDRWKMSVGGLKLVVNSTDGNMGLGIFNPLDRLHVKDSIRIEHTTAPGLSLYQGATLAGSLIAQGFFTTISSHLVGGSLLFRTNDTDRMSIVSDGRVVINEELGIGTGAPADKLHIVGDMRLDGLVSALKFYNGGSIRSTLEQNGLNFSIANQQSGSLFFKTANTTRMYISPTGDVGIGTITPNGVLDVNGSVLFDSLGIGLGADPILEKTHIKGAVRIDNIGVTAPKINFYHDNTQVGLIQTTPVNLQIANTHIGGNIDLFTDGTERMRLHTNGDFEFNDDQLFIDESNGRVGIGTTVPADDLHVMGGMIVERNNPIVALRESGSNVGLLYHINDNLLVSNLIAGDIEFRTDNTTRMTITDDGNVGIGILNPSFKLEVGGAIRSYDEFNPGMQLFQNGNWAAMLQMVADDLVIGCLLNDAITFRTNNIGRMVIEEQGNVGVGVFDALDQLHVGGTLRIEHPGTPQLRFHQGATFGAFIQSSGDDLMVSNKLVGELRLMTNDLTRVEVFNNGDVKIDGSTFTVKAGTNQVAIGSSLTASGYKLSVDGKIMSEEIMVQLSGDWPDYVFADDYHLRSPQEIEAHIETHGHLPGVPSAAAVNEANGIHLGEMNRVLLEKVEELTLLIIEQDKRIRELEKKSDQ